jgi:adenylyltransferase/sulfurtransferase
LAVTAFTEEQIERYSRQIILPEVGGAGQAKLLAARVLVVGAGGLGSPIALYLAAAGVGRIGIVDSDCVDISNLQRQILHGTADLGRQKCFSAKEAISSVNPDVLVTPYPVRLNSGNILDIISDYDVVADGSDNFPTRYLVNDACVLAAKPLSHAGILRFEGQVTTIIPGQGPCYRCLYPDPPPPGLMPSCQQAGVLGATAGVIGAIQATEVMKLILGIGQCLVGRILIYDGLAMSCRVVRVERDAACPICGDSPALAGLVDYDHFCGLAAAQEHDHE